MSYTSNSINGLKNLRSGEGWERKTIKLVDVVSDDEDIVLEPYRDWMLGGEHMEWRTHKDKITGDIIIERR